MYLLFRYWFVHLAHSIEGICAFCIYKYLLLFCIMIAMNKTKKHIGGNIWLL
jgi:hypothetical protein